MAGVVGVNHPAITAVFGFVGGAGLDLYASGAAPSESTRLGARGLDRRGSDCLRGMCATAIDQLFSRAGSGQSPGIFTGGPYGTDAASAAMPPDRSWPLPVSGSAYELPITLDHQTRSVCDDALMSVADHQTLRVLEGRYVLERAVSDVEVARDGEVLAVVRGPDGGACMRRQDAADDAWVALWNGDEAHPPDATGMLAAIVAPLAAGNVPVWVAASFDGDIVLIPIDQVDEASELLRRAGHRVIG